MDNRFIFNVFFRKPRINDVIFLTVQETRVIPIGIIDENDSAVETNEEQIKTEDDHNGEVENLNDTEEKENSKIEEVEE